MRVDPNLRIRPAAVRREGKTASGTGGSFADALGAEGTTAPAKPASVLGVGALVALQEVPDATARRRRAVARAGNMLTRLGELQLGLIDGVLDRGGLADLAAMARSAREQVDDPALAGVLDEIELRAAVELAKLSSLL